MIALMGDKKKKMLKLTLWTFRSTPKVVMLVFSFFKSFFSEGG